MDYFLGEIRPFAFGFAPNGWAQCNGQLLQVGRYPALFSLSGSNSALLSEQVHHGNPKPL
jgi:microcystin-dependent protein